MGPCVSRPVSKKHDHHKTKPSAVVPPSPPKPQDSIHSTLPPSGSTDEPFFDTQPWLESDCDEDFHSVEGDYTPRRRSFVTHRSSTGTSLARTLSHGNTRTSSLLKTSSTKSCISTPLHVNSETQHSNNVVAEKQLAGYTPEIIPKEKRKKLIELFRLSRGGFADEIFINDNISVDTKTVQESVFTSVPSSPFVSDGTSVHSSARTSNVSVKSHRSRAQKSVYHVGCLNKLLKVRHKHGKGIDVRSIQERDEGNVVEVQE